MPINTLLEDLRALSGQFPLLGHRHTMMAADAGEVSGDAVVAFLGFLQESVSGLSGGIPDGSATDQQDGLGGTGARWERTRQAGAFPFLVERLVVAGQIPESAGLNTESPQFARTGPGEWTVEASVLTGASPDYLVRSEAWQAALSGWVQDPANAGGLSINVLTLPAQSLTSGELDLRPSVLRNFDGEHRAADKGSTADQQRVANAFWQTYWATGALRSERGQTFPVAFLPIDRAHPNEFQEPFHERYVSLRRRLFGRTSILAYVMESLTRERALFVDPATGLYSVDPDYDPAKASWSTTAADVALALDELERTGWVDAYTGTNKELFAGLESSPAKPWPYGDGADKKIRAKGPAEDFLRARRLDPHRLNTLQRIHRVIPYAAAATLGQVFHETVDLQSRGKLAMLDGEILAGTNSTFFLNFSEEYGGVHSAMNDPVSSLVEQGRTHQLKTLRRAAFILTESGEAMITTRLGNHLESEVLFFEGEAVTATAMRGASKPPGANRVGPLFFGAVIVGDSIVETFEESASEVPANGWITGDSEAFGGRIRATGAVRASLRRSGDLAETQIRHAFAVGPLLLEGGKVVPWGESREDFIPYSGPPVSAAETRELARTEIPPSMQAASQVGVPPTRFPHDWDRTRAPRTGLGITAEGDVKLVVVDGRANLPHSVGVSLAELATVMQGVGCVDAMNLDGGGSSVMYLAGEEPAQYRLRDDLRPGVVNLPSDLGGVERLLPVPLLVIARKSSP